MKRILFAIIGVVCLLPQKLFAQTEVYVAKRRAIYLFVKGDTAVLDYFIIDLPSIYVPYDTLIFQPAANKFKSRKTILSLKEGGYIIDSATQKSLSGVQFHLPNKRELKYYYYRYNSDLEYKYLKSVGERKDQGFQSELEREEFTKAWDYLQLSREDISPAAYKDKMNTFLERYSIQSHCTK